MHQSHLFATLIEDNLWLGIDGGSGAQGRISMFWGVMEGAKRTCVGLHCTLYSCNHFRRRSFADSVSQSPIRDASLFLAKTDKEAKPMAVTARNSASSGSLPLRQLTRSLPAFGRLAQCTAHWPAPLIVPCRDQQKFDQIFQATTVLCYRTSNRRERT